MDYIVTIPISHTYVSKEKGWVWSENWQFLLTFSGIYADRKSPKMYGRNIGMVPWTMSDMVKYKGSEL